MTGWGQAGPLSDAAGDDINYIVLTGALHGIGNAKGKPVPPLNLVGDFGGGALYLALGVVCGILEAQRSGKGQIVDVAMTDGSASLMAMFYGMSATGMWKDERGVNLLDGGAHFYDTYETKDGKYVALGSIEPQFYKELIEKTAITDAAFAAQMDRNAWLSLKEKLSAVIKTKTRDEWDKIMLGSDVCYAPVLTLGEAPKHPHNLARKVRVRFILHACPSRNSLSPAPLSDAARPCRLLRAQGSRDGRPSFRAVDRTRQERSRSGRQSAVTCRVRACGVFRSAENARDCRDRTVLHQGRSQT
jgi:crotonobetainyl-CoA:carnitine CoA-transferase CaiB-like acyl-CoA transferase